MDINTKNKSCQYKIGAVPILINRDSAYFCFFLGLPLGNGIILLPKNFSSFVMKAPLPSGLPLKVLALIFVTVEASSLCERYSCQSSMSIYFLVSSNAKILAALLRC